MSSAGVEALELARSAGVYPDDWQVFSIEAATGERADGKWSAFEVGITVSRQNGKGEILLILELAGLYVWDERLITHSAHLFDTSLEAFRRLLDVIEGSDDLLRRVKRLSRSHGEEGIELYGPKGRRRTGGQRIRFRTRTKGGGRGFTGDRVVLDEDMVIAEAFHGALLPTVSARSIHGNPQIVYTGSAVDEDVHEHGVVKARIRKRGLEQDPAVCYLEWSADAVLEAKPGKDAPLAMDQRVATDPAHWAAANPALGIRISGEHIGLEQRSMSPRNFAVERLGVGAWPRTDMDAGDGIPLEVWQALEDRTSAPVDPVCFALDVTPKRSHTAIGVAGARADGLRHVEIVEHRPGTGWAAARAVELVKTHRAVGLVIDLASPAASLIPELTNLGLEVRSKDAPAGKLITVGSSEHAQAFGMFFDACDQAALRHLGDDRLEAAVKGGVRRPLGEGHAWSRKASDVDISPLVTVTLANWGSATIQDGADLWMSFS